MRQCSSLLFVFNFGCNVSGADPGFFLGVGSHQVRESNTVLESGIHVLDSGFKLLDLRSFSVELGFRIPILVGFRIPPAQISKIPDSTCENFPDSGIADFLTCGEGGAPLRNDAADW